LGAFVISSPAKAECPYSPTFPPVTEAARSAREFIVGKVLGYVSGHGTTFRMRIDYVLRGSARVGDVRAIKNLPPNWPVEVVDGTRRTPCTVLAPSPGNTIAIAFDALAPDGRTRYNAASWVYGMPEWMIDVERTTLAELFALGALPRTDTAASPVASSTAVHEDSRTLSLLIVFIVALLASARLDWRTRRRS
jgi:hypothetical protein